MYFGFRDVFILSPNFNIMKTRIIMVALLFIGFATTTQASNIFDVLAQQRLSIDNAYRYGKINRIEARSLMSEQTRIEQAIYKAEKDGRISNREITNIRRLQKRADTNIYAASISSRRFNSYNQGVYNNRSYNNCRVNRGGRY